MSKELIRKRARQFGVILAVWTGLALIEAFQYYFGFLDSSRDTTFGYELSYAFKDSMVSAVLTPMVLWIASRYPLGRRNVSITVVAHVLGAATYWVSFVALRMPLGQIVDFTTGKEGQPSWMFYRRLLLRYPSDVAWMYGAIVIAGQLWDYYNKYRERELRASRLEAQLAQAQLKVLKMQLDPHFLFNTLHSISSLMHEDVEAADDVLARLSDLLRMSLEDVDEQEVTLKREMEFLDGYLAIQQMRFRDRFKVRVHIDPRSLDALVPNMILQPLVENAVRHGIASRSGAGHLDVRSSLENGTLRLEVLDDGPGPADDLGVVDGSGAGVGLSNTKARLQQLYGDAHRFSLCRPDQGGTLVTLEIPFRLKSEEAASPAMLSD
ncbi:MAG TPA: histidine kinase [Terriglobia bacterium]|jgi:signal transduction histidine kinase|nr:histidine kinase [Terriglobia bacterium]